MFGAGLQLGDLWTIQLDSWFGVFHPVIYYLILTKVMKKPRSVNKQK
jgi:hypothetical protein